MKSVGRQAAKDIGSQFDSLTESIDEKSQSLADDLAEKYVAARQVVDDEITKMQEENKVCGTRPRMRSAVRSRPS